MKEIIIKFRRGEPITNKELMALWEHYDALNELLNEHGEMYRLVANDVAKEFDRATDMLKERRKKIIKTI